MTPPPTDSTDDLIAAARAAGRAYVASFDGDLTAVCADFRRRTAHEPWTVASRPPKPPHPWQTGSTPTRMAV